MKLLKGGVASWGSRKKVKMKLILKNYNKLSFFARSFFRAKSHGHETFFLFLFKIPTSAIQVAFKKAVIANVSRCSPWSIFEENYPHQWQEAYDFLFISDALYLAVN